MNTIIDRKEALLVIVIGSEYKKSYDKYFRPSHERFARKIDRPLIVLTDYIDKSERGVGRSPAWQKLLMFQAPQAQKYDRLCYIDADIYITRQARDPFESTGSDTCGMVKNNPYDLPKLALSDLKLYSKCPPQNRPDYVLNSGFIVAERNIHQNIFRYIYEHYDEQTCYEQGPLSYHLINDYKITVLDVHFNAVNDSTMSKYPLLWPFQIHKLGFVHFAGGIFKELVTSVQYIDENPNTGTFVIMTKLAGRKIISRFKKILSKK